MVQAQDILEFWFSEQGRRYWFQSTEELDREIQKKFESTWEAARDGKLEDWKHSPEGALALVIVLDQFPLNMYRGQAKSFSTEAKAREISRYALAEGFDSQLDQSYKFFLFLPFMHSESMEDQERSVELFTGAGLETRWAKHHREIVRRFGRFPHRNASLGRQSSEEELAYLQSDEAFKG